MILGIDFWRTYRAVIDLDLDEISLGRNHYCHTNDPRANTDDPQPLLFRLAHTTAVQPRTIAKITVDTGARQTHIADKTFLVAPTPNLWLKKSISMPSSLIETNQGRATIWVENHSAERITLAQGMVVANGFHIMNPGTNPKIATITAGTNERVQRITNNRQLFADTINKDLSNHEREQLFDILAPFSTMVPKEGDPPRRTPHVTHTIDTGAAPPVRRRYTRRYAPVERKIIEEEVRTMKKQGIIRPSTSPWSSPVVLVQEKNGEYRFCVDYRELNKITRNDTYPLPRIDDALDCLAGSKYFSSLDLKQGYFQCPVEQKDIEKTAFVTPDGLYEFTAMPFGLCNAPATFERLMDTILRGHKWTSCLVYLDDICVFGRTLQEHNERLRDVLDCLNEANLSLNIKKCSFGATRLKILAHEITSAGVRPDPINVEAIRDFPTPVNQKAVRSFLGLCSYYRKFIPNFSKLAAPLNELLKYGVAFTWTTPEKAAFANL